MESAASWTNNADIVLDARTRGSYRTFALSAHFSVETEDRSIRDVHRLQLVHPRGGVMRRQLRSDPEPRTTEPLTLGTNRCAAA